MWPLFLDMERSLLSLLRSLFLSFFPLEQAKLGRGGEGGGSEKGRFGRRFEAALAAASTFSVRGIGLFFEGFWIDLCCSSSCRPWLMITRLITCCLTFLRQRYDLEVFFSARLLGLTHLVRLRLRLLSLEWERLLWPCRELWESGPNLHGTIWKNEPLSWEKLEIGHSHQRTCVSNGTFSCVIWSEKRSGSVGAVWSGWENASLCPLRREERPQQQDGQSRRCSDAQTRRSTPYPALWQRRWWTGLPSPSSSRSPAPWQQLAASSPEVWRWRCWSDWSWNTHSTLYSERVSIERGRFNRLGFNTDFRGRSPNMTPLKVSALATESCSENSTKAKRVGCVSSPAIRTNFTLPTWLKNSSSCSAVVVCKQEESGAPPISWAWTRGRRWPPRIQHPVTWEFRLPT